MYLFNVMDIELLQAMYFLEMLLHKYIRLSIFNEYYSYLLRPVIRVIRIGCLHKTKEKIQYTQTVQCIAAQATDTEWIYSNVYIYLRFYEKIHSRLLFHISCNMISYGEYLCGVWEIPILMSLKSVSFICILRRCSSFKLAIKKPFSLHFFKRYRHTTNFSTYKWNFFVWKDHKIIILLDSPFFFLVLFCYKFGKCS